MSAREAVLTAATTRPVRVGSQLVVLGVVATLLGVFTSAFEVIMPLWVTGDLGGDAGTWARLRSLRFTGVLVGVILLGALSDRIGPKAGGIVTLLGAAVTLAAVALGPDQTIWWLMPALGALLSTAYVNLNALTQAISITKQGLSNSVYRGTAAAAGIVTPAAATALVAPMGYRGVLLLAAAIVVAAGVAMGGLQDRSPVAAFTSWRDERRALWQTYTTPLKQKHLVRFLHLSNALVAALLASGTFAAIRLTRELGQSEQDFGLLASATGVVTLLATVLVGLFVDHIGLRRLTIVVGVLAGMGTVVMGMSDNIVVTAAGMAAAIPMNHALLAPMSIWVSRAAGASSQSSAFALHKVITAAWIAGGVALLGVLEPVLGIRLLLLGSGVLSIALALAHRLLIEPERPGAKT